LCLSSSLALHFFPIILFGSTTLLTRMTGNSLHSYLNVMTSYAMFIRSQMELS
jgi:hypothetical protein